MSNRSFSTLRQKGLATVKDYKASKKVMNDKKINWALIGMFTVLGAAILGFLVFASPAQATGNPPPIDACNQEFTHTSTENQNGDAVDFDNARVNINIQDFSGDDDRRVVVTPKPGYALVSIGIDYDGSDANEATAPVGTGLVAVTYDAPNNQSIDHVTVVVKKVCTEVCNDEAASNYQAVTPGQTTANNDLCVYPIDVCLNLDGIQTTVPEGYTESEGVCTPIEVPVDMCSNIDGNQIEVPSGYTESDGICTEEQSDSGGGGSNNDDNDEGGISGGSAGTKENCETYQNGVWVQVPNPYDDNELVWNCKPAGWVPEGTGGSTGGSVPLSNLPYTGFEWADMAKAIGSVLIATVIVFLGATGVVMYLNRRKS